MIRLLDILSNCLDGATQYELVAQDVRPSLIYEVVMLSLVYAKVGTRFRADRLSVRDPARRHGAAGRPE
jgi:hypothetical protein